MTTAHPLPDGARPPSPVQEGVWLFERTHPNTSAQNVAAVLTLPNAVDASALADALGRVLGEREELGYGIADNGGQPLVVQAPPRINADEIRTASGEETSARMRRLVDRPFALDQPPLLRCALIHPAGEPSRLVLVGHRLVVDGRGVCRLLERVAQACGHPGDAGGQGPPASGASGSRAGQAPLAEQLAHWRARFPEGPPELLLPTGDNRDRKRTFRDHIAEADASEALMHALGKTDPAAAYDDPEGVLLTAFATLLSRYSGQTELVLGWSRQRAGGAEESPDAPWENWLPLPLDLDPGASFRDNAARVRQAADEADTHGDIPFARLLRELPVSRRSARPPLVQALFEYREVPAGGALGVPPTATPLDLHLLIEDRGNGLRCQLLHNSDLIDPESGQQLLANLLHLAQAALAQPETPIGQLPLLAPDQHRRIVHDFNRTDAPYPADRCLHELVAEQAARTPEAPAYVFEGRTATYAEVDGWANAVATRLKAAGIGPGDFVPLLMDRSLELPVAMLGVMKAGAAYVPMDVHWPAERIEQIVADAAEAPLVVLGPGAEAGQRVPEQARTLTLTLDELEQAAPPEAPGITPDDPIYMIYTSGSTGRPKGTINRHRGIVNRLTYMTRRYGCGPEDVILQTSAHIFDASVWQLFWPLINGRLSVLPSPMVGFNYQHITGLIERHRVTVTDFVPSVFNILVDFLETDEAMRARLGTLRQVLIGGEALSPAPAFRFRELLPGIGITNTYGPTETSIGVIFYEVGDDDEDPLPIGRPIDNVKTFILDGAMQPVPVGVPGTLFLGGECVGLGYHRNPEKTAAAFPETPFPDVHPGRLYNTGDLARYRADGTIEFLGRADHQVKIRGLRVELGEIEAALARHPAVQSAVVTLREDDGGKKLAAYLVPAPGESPTAQALRAFLRERIPEYIIPHSFTFLAEMPLLRSGKIDRQALPEPVAAAAEPERRGPPPATATEETIARAWREEIGIGFVSLHDNFFELGGDSLGVVKVAARLEQEAGILLDAEQMMIQSLGQLAAAADGGTSDHAAPGAGPDRTTIAPRLFGPAGAELYGCLHPAADPAADCGVLVCPPLGHEYIFTHRALRHTAHKLAAEGIPVLRFDYPGTGDSAGEEADVTLAGCVDGIVTATAELGEQTGVSHVHLLGLRLGASLAAMAAPRLEGLAGVVLWDPVTDGQAYLRELTALHRHWLGRRAPAFRTEADGREVGELLGFPLSRPLHDAIAAVDETPFAALGNQPVLWIDSTEDGREAERAARLGHAAPGLAYRPIPYPEIWNQDPYKARLPHAIIDTASGWIAERAE